MEAEEEEMGNGNPCLRAGVHCVCFSCSRSHLHQVFSRVE